MFTWNAVALWRSLSNQFRLLIRQTFTRKINKISTCCCCYVNFDNTKNSKIADTCSRLIDSIRAHNQKESFTKWILSKRIIVVVSGLLAFVVNKDIFYFYFFENVQLNVSSCTINNNYYRQQLVFSPFLIHWQYTAVL